MTYHHVQKTTAQPLRKNHPFIRRAVIVIHFKMRGLAELGVTKSVEQFPKHLKTHVQLLRKKFYGCYLTINFKEENFSSLLLSGVAQMLFI